MKKLKTVLGVTASLLVVAFTFAADFFYGEAVERGREVELHREEIAIPAMVTAENEQIIDEAAEWYENQSFETMTLTSYDGLTLEADFLANEESTDQAVILAHGFRSQRADMGDYVQFYYDQGFDILIPDSRGHGESEGDYVSFGWHDRLDYLDWINVLIEKTGSSSIFLHGHSMGAATVLMTSGEELPPQVKGVIADSGYTSAEDILSYQLENLYNLPPFPMIPVTSGMTKIRSGFTFGEASVIDQVAKNTLPLLLIHGEADELVPTSMTEEIYEAAGGDKTLWLVPEAGHVKSYSTSTTEYQERLMEFINRED
ncbi:alpha/beta hydrolase [Salipaludibacillus keqinensis]|uniref:Alpha/beta hydrolase n=1 Tax=Salipaludibacillus keqinensis TaxID=2045207 RepID=A0A323TLV2_9BACI|nr:alpha/beta hydrolase [Salipaludibacillus keqinensis]PYZ94954.1 alpha/beta hydrolase [Salipaludibacillus keqinensis]